METMKTFAFYDDIMNLQNISKMFAQILGITHIKTKDKEFISVCAKHLIFEVKPPRLPKINPLDFYL